MSDPKDKPKHQPSPKHTLEEVLRSLQDLVRNELADEVPAGQGKTVKDKKPVSEKSPGTSAEKPPEKPAEKPAEKPKEKPKKPAAAAAKPDTAGGIQEELPLPAEGPAAPAESSPAGAAPPPAGLNWDDIPVLQDVVVAPPLRGAMPPQRLQALTERVVAQFNEALRQAGQPRLDPVMIPRLAELLREALAAEIEPPVK